jgi:nitronate monooxygenase
MLQQARALAQRLSSTFPLIIQAPMAGGITSPALVAAVSNAKGVGSFATGYLSAEQVQLGIQRIKALTKHPFAVNVFIPNEPTQNNAQAKCYQDALNQFKQALNLPEAYELPSSLVAENNFQSIIDVLLQEQVSIVSFTFGNLPAETIQAFKSNGTYLIGTATSLEEARLLADSKIDAIVLQGHEAGGHRGGFLTPSQNSSIGTMAFIPQVAKHIKLPLIAAGGIMDGSGIVAALALGASGVQMGTAFLTTAESTANEMYKKSLLNLRDSAFDSTTATTAYSGKTSRGIHTPFIDHIEAVVPEIPAYPIPNILSSSLRKEAIKQGVFNYMPMWSGQGVSGIRDNLTAKQLLQQLRAEIQAALNDLTDNQQT